MNTKTFEGYEQEVEDLIKIIEKSIGEIEEIDRYDLAIIKAFYKAVADQDTRYEKMRAVSVSQETVDVVLEFIEAYERVFGELDDLDVDDIGAVNQRERAKWWASVIGGRLTSSQSRFTVEIDQVRDTKSAIFHVMDALKACRRLQEIKEELEKCASTDTSERGKANTANIFECQDILDNEIIEKLDDYEELFESLRKLLDYIYDFAGAVYDEKIMVLLVDIIKEHI